MAAKPFKEMSSNIYIICSELFLISFYMTLMVGILSMGALSIDTVGAAGIKICIGALGVNIFYAIYQAAMSIYNKSCGKKTNKVHPVGGESGEQSVQNERVNVTTIHPEEPCEEKIGEYNIKHYFPKREKFSFG